MLKGFKPLWKTAAVAVVVLVALLFLANGQRMRRLEQIRNELGQLELGMTRQEVRDALTIHPSSKSKPDKTTGSDDTVVMWSFSTFPRIEAVQPHIVFDSATGRLIDIVVGEHRSDAEATWSGD